jgi:hypothetical protein
MKNRQSVAAGDNKGIKYETHINQILKQKKLQEGKMKSAGATDKPDGYFFFDGESYPIEIKKDLSADFAQVELDWTAKNGFSYSTKSKNGKYISFLEKEDFLAEINKKWNHTPKKFTEGQGNGFNRNWDLDHFPDIRKEIGTKAIRLVEKFYTLKNPPIHYMQIGGRGIFYMDSNPLGLSSSRLNGEGVLRARVKTRSLSRNAWGFLVAIKVRGVEQSVCDIEEAAGRFFPFPLDKKNLSIQKNLKSGSLTGFLK